MAVKKGGLGKGFDALWKESSTEDAGKTVSLRLVDVASSPERATDYRRGQATRSPRSRDPQQITPPWGGVKMQKMIHCIPF